MISNGYAAGFFDGEGSIYNRRYKGHDKLPAIRISQNEREVLDLFADKWGGAVKMETHRPVFYWILAKAELQKAFLLAIRSQVVVKKVQVDAAFRALATMSVLGRNLSDEQRGRRREACDAISRANRGKGGAIKAAYR